MLDRREPGGRSGTDPLRRRIARDQFGMLLLEPLQLRVELVVLLVGDLRVVLLVVQVDVAVQLLTEFRDLFPGIA